MGQSERLYAGKQSIRQALTHAVDRGGHRPGDGDRGGGSPPPRTSWIRGTMHQSRGSPTRQIGAVFMEILAEILP